MSIPALLSHFGISESRYVTTTGEIIFDGVMATGSGFAHPTRGSVVPVAAHTFHGGEATLDYPSTGRMWWDDPDQIARHVDAMDSAFPAFEYIPASEKCPPSWTGTIDTGKGCFRVSINLRADRGLPRVGVARGIRLGINSGRWWTPAPHLYTNGYLCVADQDDWDPSEHTAATATAWAAHWFAAYTEWRITRRWPVEGAQPRAL